MESNIQINISEAKDFWSLEERGTGQKLRVFYKKISESKVLFLVFTACYDDFSTQKYFLYVKELRTSLDSTKDASFGRSGSLFGFGKDSKYTITSSNDSFFFVFDPLSISFISLSVGKSLADFSSSYIYSDLELFCNESVDDSNYDVTLHVKNTMKGSESDASNQENKNSIQTQKYILSYYSAFLRSFFNKYPGVTLEPGKFPSDKYIKYLKFDKKSHKIEIGVDCSYLALKTVIDFLHTQVVPSDTIINGTNELWIEILDISLLWKIFKLQRLALLLAYGNIDVDNACTLLEYSLEIKNSIDIYKYVNDYIVANWKSIPKRR